MKKTVIALAAVSLLFVFSTSIPAKATFQEHDSRNIPDEIKEKIGVLVPYETADGSIELRESENVSTVMKAYSVSFICEVYDNGDIDNILTGDCTNEFFYVVTYSDGTQMFYGEQGDELHSESYTYMDGEKVPLPPRNIPTQAFAEYTSQSSLRMVFPNCIIKDIYYLSGESNIEGTAIHYNTNVGEYVYYFNPMLGEVYEYFFPLDEFCNLQQAINDEISKHPNVEGGIQLSDIWDLSQYNIHSENFAPNAPNVNLPAEQNEPSNDFLLWGIIAGGIILAAGAVLAVIIIRRKKAK